MDSIKSRVQEQKLKQLARNRGEQLVHTAPATAPPQTQTARSDRLSMQSILAEQVDKQDLLQIQRDVQCQLERYSQQQENSIQDQSDKDKPRRQIKTFKKIQEGKPDHPELGQMNQLQVIAALKSKSFGDFFDKSSKLLLKAIEEPEVQAKEHGVKTMTSLKDSHYTRGRVVTSVSWSPHLDRGNVLLASYSKRFDGNIKDKVGVVLVWSLSLRTRPQFYCFSQTEVTTATFYPFSRNELIGGCYNGELQVWDLRAKTMPVLRTNLADMGHKFPVFSLQIIGTSMSHCIVSGSNDGQICTWDLRHFGGPVTSQLLQEKSKAEVNVTGLEFGRGDSNTYYFGTQSGNVGVWSLHHAQESQERDFKFRIGHKSQVSALSVNNWEGEHSSMLQGLLVSTSLDWTARLWSKTGKGLWTFDFAEDYLYDVGWCPSNPVVFATCDNQGYLDVWNLLQDLEVPTRTKICQSGINKLKWGEEGGRIACGDSEGNVVVAHVNLGSWGQEDKLQQLEQLLAKDGQLNLA